MIKNDSVGCLQDKASGQGMNQFVVGNEKLEMHNLSGQSIKSSFADNNILSKTKP